jgi:hypothetical protein
MWIIAAARLAGSLPVLRWPFYGAIIAIAVDQSDLFLMNLIHLGGVNDYQAFDKYLDQAYLLTFLLVALRWQGTERNVAAGLFGYRFAGFLAFEVTQSRGLLLFFPNLFEFWFVFVASLPHWNPAFGFTPRRVALTNAVLLAAKETQEFVLHWGRWLDRFTAIEAVEAIWRWLTPPY